MQYFRKLISATVTAAILALTCQTAQAEEYYSTEVGGCGYEECRQSPCLTPAIALGAIALVAIVAVALQDSHSSHGHCH